MFESDILKTMRRYRMLDGVRSLCVACSGGPDSTALLYFLAGIAKTSKIKMSVAHVHHGLRGRDSDRDQNFVKKFAASFQFPFYSTKVNVQQEAKLKRLSIEEAARDLRYAYFIKLAKAQKFDAVALAHTMDDQAETVLMRLLAGSGIQGLGGARTVFFREKIRFLRPFINIEKSRILQFLKKQKIAFRWDKSNESTQFVRNRIRFELIPFLEKKFSLGIKKILARLPAVLAADIDFLNSESAKYFKRLGKIKKKDEVQFAKPKFMKLPEAIQFRLLQFALRKLHSGTVIASGAKQSQNVDCFGNVLNAPRNDQVLEFESKHWFLFRAMLKEKSRFTASFTGNLACSVSEDDISIRFSKPLPKNQENGFQYSLKLGQKIKIPESGILIEARKLSRCPRNLKKRREDFVIVDASRIHFPLQIRSRRPGDLFQPLGQVKPSKLKDFLIRRKIPQAKRDRLPLVFSGNKMNWIPGVAVSELVKVTKNTRSFLKLSINPA